MATTSKCAALPTESINRPSTALQPTLNPFLCFVGERGGDEGLARTRGGCLHRERLSRGENEVRPGAPRITTSIMAWLLGTVLGAVFAHGDAEKLSEVM